MQTERMISIKLETPTISLPEVYANAERKVLIAYIQDLQKTNIINKEVIKDFCNASKLTQDAKDVIKKLNEENLLLHMQLKLSTKNKLDIMGTSLIQQQIMKEDKTQISKWISDYNSMNKNMNEKIEEKDIALINIQKQCKDLYDLVIKYISHLPDAKKVLKGININQAIDGKVNKLCEANKNLKAKVSMLMRALKKSQQLAFNTRDSLVTKDTISNYEDSQIKIDSSKIIHRNQCSQQNFKKFGLWNNNGKECKITY